MRLGKGLRHESLYADGLIFTSDSMGSILKKLTNWKDSIKSKGLKINNRKTKLMVSGSKGELPTSKIDPYGIRGKMVPTNFMLSINAKESMDDAVNGKS